MKAGFEDVHTLNLEYEYLYRSVVQRSAKKLSTLHLVT
jgi:hypothetical protein